MNEIYKFKFTKNKNHSYKYLVDIVTLKILKNDRFWMFKQPLSIFLKENNLNDPNEYLKRMKEETKKKYSSYIPVSEEEMFSNHKNFFLFLSDFNIK